MVRYVSWIDICIKYFALIAVTINALVSLVFLVSRIQLIGLVTHVRRNMIWNANNLKFPGYCVDAQKEVKKSEENGKIRFLD